MKKNNELLLASVFGISLGLIGCDSATKKSEAGSEDVKKETTPLTVGLPSTSPTEEEINPVGLPAMHQVCIVSDKTRYDYNCNDEKWNASALDGRSCYYDNCKPNSDNECDQYGTELSAAISPSENDNCSEANPIEL